MNIYDFSFKTADGDTISFDKYKGKVLILVNTASKCGFTPQYEDLEKLYEKYSEKGVEIIGFPCNQFADQEPGSSSEAKNFCQLNYGVSFPISEKIEVRGKNMNPIFSYLTSVLPFKGFNTDNISAKIFQSFLEEKFPEYLIGNSIKWNFTKFIMDKNGNPAARFEPTVEPMDMEDFIKSLL
ncbi:glutathione peroxidase [Clostridium sp. 19966]|uniref:glutathione peroxidase n=1 Tax=Clostridium sp. 19966 TaxID=2768166 RepID=UPI0028DEB33F|nr:glutathione peroxidase [Clostridium sp. 19966]MDT8717237.1 glutathione peroxidase [Clostridium sp. 19966]